jgi:hypothetical protein
MTVTAVHLGLTYSLPHCLARRADLRRDRADRLPLRAVLTRVDLLKHQRNRAFPHVTRVCLAPSRVPQLTRRLDTEMGG